MRHEQSLDTMVVLFYQSFQNFNCQMFENEKRLWLCSPLQQGK